MILETNIDDMNPQLYPVLIDRLLAAGAHDAYLIPVIMKKGRPGHPSLGPDGPDHALEDIAAT